MTDTEQSIEPPPRVVVTGSAGLIGAHIVDVLTERGAVVIGVDADATSARRPPESPILRVDVTDEAAVAAAAASIRNSHGAIDTVVHAAALTGRSPALPRAPLRSVGVDSWRHVLDVNVTGALLCAREFGALIRSGPRAQILLVGSIQGLVPTLGASAYAVSKAALVGLVRQLAAEYASDGVRINLVAPGPVADDAELASLSADADAVLDPTPIGRFGRPREVAEAIADLTSASFSLLTGAVVPLDGGEHLRPRTGPKRAADG